MTPGPVPMVLRLWVAAPICPIRVMRLRMRSMAILRLLGASSRAPDTFPLYNRPQIRDQYILHPNSEAHTTMTVDLPRLRAIMTSTQITTTAVTTTATPTTTLGPLPAMDQNMANRAWNALERLPGSGHRLPADTAESERFVNQRALVSYVVTLFDFFPFIF